MFALGAVLANAAEPSTRVDEIAAMLPGEAKSFAPSFDNRAVWDKLAAEEEFRIATVKKAVWMLTQTSPVVTDAQWDEAIKTRDRKIDNVLDIRRNRLATFVLAEGMENKGQFIPAILKEIETICSERSWIMPAHQSFTGENDLGSAMTSWSVSTALSMLGERMPEAQRKVVKEQIIARVIMPYLAQVRDPSKKADWWRTNPNNWNAVVHAGIVGSALTVVDSSRERAEVLAASEKELPFYLAGFPTDGYSHEGMGYWKYGFGHYILLVETVRAATGGKLDFLKDPVARKIAEFPQRFEVAPGIYPAYGDCQLYEPPISWLYEILSTRFGIGQSNSRTLTLESTFFNFLYAWGVNLSFEAGPTSPATPVKRPLHEWFDQSQVLVSRSAPGVSPALGVSMKGGNNGVPHSHTDLGQFVVTVNGKLVLADPGVTDYNASTMGAQRYENKAINSYGHSVPLINGKIQGNGPAFSSHVVATSFTDNMDSVTLNLRGAYNVFALNELTRKLDFDRQAGSITITDKMTADRPITFGTALITYGVAREESPGVWIITQEGQSLRAKIDAGGADFTVTPELLKDKTRAGTVNRIGINLKDPVAQATVITTITSLP